MAINQSGNNKSLFGLITGLVFFLNAVIFFFQAMTKNVFPPLLLPLRESFMIDNAQAGLLVTLVFLGYALARFPSGILADKIGCTKTVLAGSAAMAVSFLAVAVSPGYPVMALMTFILGLSSGVYVTAGYTLAVIIGSRRRAATATAAFESFGMVAGIISPALVTVFILYLSWPLLFVVLGAGLALVTLLLYRYRRRSISLEGDPAQGKCFGSCKDKAEQAGQSPLRRLAGEMTNSTKVFRDPMIRRFILWSTLVGGLGAVSWTGINSFIPTFLVEERGYSYDLANRMFIVIALAGLAAKIATGWLADRYGNNMVLFLNLAVSVGMFFALTVSTVHWQLLLILALLGASCLNTNTLINSYVLRHMPPKYQGAGFGLFCTAYTVVYSFGPYLTGFLSESLGLSRAIQLSSLGAVMAMVLILFAGRFVPRSMVERLAASSYDSR